MNQEEKMGVGVEVVAQESEENEAFLDVSDTPEADETSSPEEKEAVLLEGDLIPLNSENSCLSQEKVAEKEENARFLDLSENDKAALQELKHLIQEALENHEFGGDIAFEEKNALKSDTPETETEKGSIPDTDEDGAKTVEAIEETVVSRAPSNHTGVKTPVIVSKGVSIWGIKLLEDEKSDVILLKFLQAREFKVNEAFTMLKNTLKWRKEFGIEELMEEDLGLETDLQKVVFMHGRSKQGHPVCYNGYGEFQDKELYRKMFSDEEKRRRFLRWRIQFLEKSIRKLDFIPGGISTIIYVNDLKNSPGPNRWQLRQAVNQALHLLQDNYPEFVAKQIFINVPWWYVALSKMISPFLTQRSKSKFIVAGPARSTETLLKYVSAEQIPLHYGGLSNGGNFEADESATEIVLKALAQQTVEFHANEGSVVMWEARVVGWEASYGAEFVPSAEDGYTVIIKKIQKIKALAEMEEEKLIADSYKVSEPGKLLLTFHNHTSRNKILVYRIHSKSSV